MKKQQMNLVLALMLIGNLLTGCGEGGSSPMKMANNATADTAASATAEFYEGVAYDNGIAYDTAAADAGGAGEEFISDEKAEMPAENEVASAVNQTQNNVDITLLEEKLVYYCDLEIETLEYQASMASIKETITKYGGVIQSEIENDSGAEWYYSDYQKTGGTMHNYMQVRVPSEKYESFLAELDGVGKIISKSTSVDNISQRYYDTASKIEALQIQERNLLAMMEKCETIEDMITVEQRLSDVQYELGNLQTDRRYMDMDVAYSYVNINVTEVMEYRRDSEHIRQNTFMDRLKNTVKGSGRGFLYFLEGLLFLVIGMLPYIIILAVVYFVFFRKRVRRLLEKRKKGQDDDKK